MRSRWWLLASLAAVSAVPVSVCADPPRAALVAPAAVLLESSGESDQTEVVIRTVGANTAPVRIGRVQHVEGSARRGAVLPSGEEALVVVAERPSRHASTYNSALFRVGGGVTTRLVGGLTDASAPMVTARGAVLVQRGTEGPEPALDPQHRALRERVDALTLDRVDPATGAAVTVWRGSGQIAFLAAAMGGDEVLVYQVAPGGASLFSLDARSGATHALMTAMPALARDFSYDAAHDEVVFARAAAMGSEDYEVVAIPAHGAVAQPRVLVRAASDHLMPRVLRDGAVAFCAAGDGGLAVVSHGETAPVRWALQGPGSDAAVGESADGQWVVYRHATPARETLSFLRRYEGRVAVLELPDRAVEFLGFAEPRSVR